MRAENFIPMPKILKQVLSFAENAEISAIQLDKLLLQAAAQPLRARTFEGHPACSFWDNGVKYEVRVEIKKAI